MLIYESKPYSRVCRCTRNHLCLVKVHITDYSPTEAAFREEIASLLKDLLDKVESLYSKNVVMHAMELKPDMPFRSDELCRTFNDDDHVRVLNGQYEEGNMHVDRDPFTRNSLNFIRILVVRARMAPRSENEYDYANARRCIKSPRNESLGTIKEDDYADVRRCIKIPRDENLGTIKEDVLNLLPQCQHLYANGKLLPMILLRLPEIDCFNNPLNQAFYLPNPFNKPQVEVLGDEN